MEIVKTFNSNQLHTDIIIKGTHMEPLFRASDIGMILDITNRRTSITDFNETEKVVHTMKTVVGNQQVFFLTEKGLYKVLFKSRKPIAEKFKCWVCEVIKEIRLTGEYKLNKENEELKQQLEQKEEEITKNQSTITNLHYKNIELEKFKTHEFLIDYNKKKNLVYFCILQSFVDNSFIMKIGWTKDIETRIHALSSQFGIKVIILNVFVCENSYNLEQFLHNNAEIVKYKYTGLINNKGCSTEAYHIPSQKEYEKIVKFTNNEMNKYNSIELTKLRIEEKKIDLVSLLIPLCKCYADIMSILDRLTSPFRQLKDELEPEEKSFIQNENENDNVMNNKIENEIIVNDENFNKTIRNEIIETISLPLPEKKKVIRNKGIKIKQLHPITNEIIKIFSSYTDIQKELNIYPKKIKELVDSNEIYKGKFKFKLL